MKSKTNSANHEVYRTMRHGAATSHQLHTHIFKGKSTFNIN